MSRNGAISGGEPVVITGAGLITCLGLTAEETWTNVAAGQCGIGAMSALESAPAGGDKPGGNGGQAPDLPGDWMPGSPREVRYLRRAIEDALKDAGLGSSTGPYAPERCSCILGTTLHGMRQGGEFLRTGNYDTLCSFSAASTMGQALDGLKLDGLGATTCSACSSGLGAIALGLTLLRSGHADLVVAGGYDPVSEYAYAGFDSMRLVAAGHLRPFCTGREGMKLAEGYAVVVLERAVEAGKRGARLIAEVRGFGESADAHHLTQPHPEGEGALRAITSALSSASMAADDIGLISAHATATPNNDASEFAAFSRAFGDRLGDIPVVGFKSHVGHTLGAAGGTELILSMMAMRARVAPPTANIRRSDLEFPSLGIVEKARPAAIGATLGTSLGFGGANTCMVLGAPREYPAPVPAISGREVLITGVGFLAPGLVGNEAFTARLHEGAAIAARAGTLDESDYADLINARRMRRLSQYSKLTLAATALALKDAGVTDVALFAESCSAILGTMHGSASFCCEYYKPIVEQGMGAANPVLFAEGVPNAASAQLSLMLGVKGSCQTIIGSRTAGLDALRLAALRIASGEWDRAIVGAAEEDVDTLNSAYRHAGMRAEGAPAAPFASGAGFVTSCGAVSLILESRQSVAGRGPGTRIRGTVAASGTARGDLRSEGGRMVDRVLRDMGDPARVVSSANGTRIDRAERMGLEKSAERRGGRIAVGSLCGYLAETFAAGPMAAIAGVLLTRLVPRIAGNTWAGDDGDATVAFGVLATDHAGFVSGTTIKPRIADESGDC